MKPYIWMDDLGTWFTDEDYQKLDESLKEGVTPLYTLKQITDERIDELADQFGAGMEQFGGCLRHLDFARAIIKEITE